MGRYENYCLIILCMNFSFCTIQIRFGGFPYSLPIISLANSPSFICCSEPIGTELCIYTPTLPFSTSKLIAVSLCSCWKRVEQRIHEKGLYLLRVFAVLYTWMTLFKPLQLNATPFPLNEVRRRIVRHQASFEVVRHRIKIV